MGKKQEKPSKNNEAKETKKAAPAVDSGSSKEHLKIKAELEQLKEKKAAAWKKVQNVVLTEKLKKGEMPKDKAKAKAYKSDRAAYDAIKAEYDKLEAKEKSLRPPKAEKTKYVYPEAISNDPAEKKRFRARMRTLAEKGITGKEAVKAAMEAAKPDAKKTKAKEEVVVAPKKGKNEKAAPVESKKEGKKKKKKSKKED